MGRCNVEYREEPCRSALNRVQGMGFGWSLITRGPMIVRDVDVLADVVRAAREAGATSIWANLLHLRPGTKEHFLAALERDWPELLPDVRPFTIESADREHKRDHLPDRRRPRGGA